MKYFIAALMSLFVCVNAHADSFVKDLSSKPVTQMELGVYKMDMLLAATIDNLGRKWGLTSGVSYKKAKVIVENDNLNIAIISTASAKNLNLRSCSRGISEFNDEFDAIESLKTVWPKESYGIDEDSFKKNASLILVIFESSNSSLHYKCQWPLASDTVLEKK